MKTSRVNYNMMDVVKFLSAILLVCAHTASERVKLPGIWDLACSIYVITVPFFFVASAFLFFLKLETSNSEDRKYRYVKYSKRIWLMYLAWSAIYFCFIAAGWIQNGVTTTDVLTYLHKSIVHSTYPTIWFLPALWIAVSLVYFFRYKVGCSVNSILAISIIFYVIGAIGYSYHDSLPLMEQINDAYIAVMKTWRNGIFNGFVYACIGLKIAMGGRGTVRQDTLFTVVFGAAFLIEAFLMKRIAPSSDANFLFMLVPFSYFFFRYVLDIQIPDSSIYVPLRKMSMLIFVSQRLFLTAIPSVVGANCIAGPWDITSNGGLALILVVAEVCLFSWLIMKLSERISVLKYLM